MTNLKEKYLNFKVQPTNYVQQSTQQTMKKTTSYGVIFSKYCRSIGYVVTKTASSVKKATLNAVDSLKLNAKLTANNYGKALHSRQQRSLYHKMKRLNENEYDAKGNCLADYIGFDTKDGVVTLKYPLLKLKSDNCTTSIDSFKFKRSFNRTLCLRTRLEQLDAIEDEIDLAHELRRLNDKTWFELKDNVIVSSNLPEDLILPDGFNFEFKNGITNQRSLSHIKMVASNIIKPKGVASDIDLVPKQVVYDNYDLFYELRRLNPKHEMKLVDPLSNDTPVNKDYLARSRAVVSECELVLDNLKSLPSLPSNFYITEDGFVTNQHMVKGGHISLKIQNFDKIKEHALSPVHIPDPKPNPTPNPTPNPNDLIPTIIDIPQPEPTPNPYPITPANSNFVTTSDKVPKSDGIKSNDHLNILTDNDYLDILTDEDDKSQNHFEIVNNSNLPEEYITNYTIDFESNLEWQKILSEKISTIEDLKVAIKDFFEKNKDIDLEHREWLTEVAEKIAEIEDTKISAKDFFESIDKIKDDEEGKSKQKKLEDFNK